MFAVNLENRDNGTNRTVELKAEWNLIGFSSEEAGISMQSDVLFVNESGVEKSWSTAAFQRDVQNQLPFYVNNETMRKYRYAPLQEPNLKPQQGYWVYANRAGNFTVKGAGGSLKGQTYKRTDLMFSNGTTELNFTNAVAENWVEEQIYYWNPDFRDPFDPSVIGRYEIIGTHRSSDIIYPWEGILIKGKKNNINLLRQN